ncbi:hypothetical protein ccbrp13_71470 [Ktedonobacteria bacterium brp13]|nr:hypothetical protein ccbrp13_71470 [Ktedonobacteria bacterium brp13]
MALFDNRLAREIIMLVRQRYGELGGALGEACQQEGLDQLNESSPLQRDLKLLIGVANGEYHRTEEAVRHAEQALTRLLKLLLGNALSSRVVIPDAFWKTDPGILVSRVRWWISVDDLITISNAAALVFGENTQANRMRIGRAIDSGFLEWVPDPSVANPQQNKRVLRPQVERLRDQRRLPE